MVNGDQFASERAPDALGTRYVVQREIGRGASSIVSLARDKQTGRDVAVKQLRAEFGQSVSADLFFGEIRKMRLLSHPNASTLLDAGVHKGLPYFVLPLYSGGTLRERMEREGQLSFTEVIRLGRVLADALEHAHSRNIIHRDVKPENILFDDNGAPILVDFGIARAVILASGEDQQTSATVIRGTIPYMSPEQAAGDKRLDGRSDVNSLACTLYEAVAGVPAFVGATTQVILAQKATHVPRPIHVYRATVPAVLEDVLAKALAIAPADRHSGAAEFRDALAAIERLPPHELKPRPRGGRIPRPVLATAAVVILVAASFGARQYVRAIEARNFARADTTQLAVFPFGGGSTSASALQSAFARWRGVTLVDSRAVAQDLSAGANPPTIEEMSRIARRARAGRFVAGSTTGQTLSATLYDARGSLLHAASVELPADSSAARRAYARIADSLLLRGAWDDAPDHLEVGSRNLPSTQLMIRGRAALYEWDLEAADSIFSSAAALDSITHRPLVWVAQVRQWRGDNRDTWLPSASAALADSLALSAHDRAVAAALVLLGEERAADACRVYRRIIDADERSFLGWYGLGECQRADHVVVPDSKSPSGWRFRSSYQATITAFVRAFDLLPTTFRGFQQDGFLRLRELLTLEFGHFPPGQSLKPNAMQFLGWPAVLGDTLVLVPVAHADISAGNISVDVAAAIAAKARLRALFRTIAARWAGSHGENAVTKEAVAISLELAGDAAAADTLAAAQSLALQPLQRTRLAASRAYVLVKVGAPGKMTLIDAARRLADSLVNAAPSPTPQEARLLAPMAALTGKCRRTVELVRIATSADPADSELAESTIANANAFVATSALGCPPPQTPSLDELSSALQSPALTHPRARLYGPSALARIVRMRAAPDAQWARTLARQSYVLSGYDELYRGHADSAKIRVSRVAAGRRALTPGEVRAEVLPEAQLWLRLGDTASAARTIGECLDHLRYQAPFSTVNAVDNVVNLAQIVRAMSFRAELRPDADARAWARVVSVLWKNADSELQPLVARMRASGG